MEIQVLIKAIKARIAIIARITLLNSFKYKLKRDKKFIKINLKLKKVNKKKKKRKNKIQK